MLTESTKRRIDLHLSKVEDREIAIWGASKFGNHIFKYLVEQGYNVSCFIDRDVNKQSDKYCERPVYDPVFTISSIQKYYIIVALTVVHEDIKAELAAYNYIIGEDYLYFFDENFTISKIKDYNDPLGNQIIGKPDNINSKVIFKGINNKLVFEKEVQLENVEISFLNDDGYCYIGGKSQYRGSIVIGMGCKVIIGHSMWVTHSCNINAAEYTEVHIGDDCMFAANNNIWTHDFHRIYDVGTGKRINASKSISIGNHVWLAQDVTVLSGSNIGDGSVIGYRSTVKSKIPSNCIAVGNPARKKKSNIAWDRKYLHTNNPYIIPDDEFIGDRKYWNDTEE